MSFTSFVVQSLWNALGVPQTKIPIDGITFASYVLPPLAFGFALALLAVMPHTRAVRIALWPLIALLSLRGALSVDVSLGRIDRRFLDVSLGLSMFAVTIRTLEWALAQGPLVRHLRPANSSPSTVMDALDLVSNLRGIGWEWSGRLYVPRQTRPADRKAFVFRALVSAIAHSMMCGTVHRALLTLIPVGLESIPGGSTIFDESLPFLVRHLRASIISVLSALVIYTSMQLNYDLSATFAILLLGQDPAQWPPVFDAPWRATSLSDFWGRRWHQLPRRILLFFGGYPLSKLLGRTGIVVGTFLASALFHHAIAMMLDGEADMWRTLVGFGMMAPGILAERAFRQWTGRRVGGVLGWIWTMTWLTLWGNEIIEGHARAGMFSCATAVDSMLPVQISVDQWVAGVDVWLHDAFPEALLLSKVA